MTGFRLRCGDYRVFFKQAGEHGTHVERLYPRLAPGKGQGRAGVAIARHLAEASYWVLGKRQPYKDPAPRPSSHAA